MAYRARKMGTATLLARCKMGEVEEQVAKLGLPAVYDSGSDACCEDAPIEGYACDWEIDPVLLPETMFMTGEEKDANATDKDKALQGAQAAAQGSTAAGLGTAQGLPGAMTGMPPAGTATPFGAASTNDPLSALNRPDSTALLSGGALGGIASMAMSMVYPMLKPAFEAQIRRATVTVRWKEGSIEHSFDVTQYLVADPPAQLTAEQAQQVGQGMQQQNGLGVPTGSTPAAATPAPGGTQ
jgi:general secretion pathway protein I